MLLAHKIELRPTKQQADYLDRACGSRHHAFNQLLAHFNQEALRFTGTPCQVTISKRAGKYFASILAQDYDPKSPADASIGVDFGIKDLAICSDGQTFAANQKLKSSLNVLTGSTEH